MAFSKVDGTYGPQLPEGKKRRTQEEKDDRLSFKFKLIICLWKYYCLKRLCFFEGFSPEHLWFIFQESIPEDQWGDLWIWGGPPRSWPRGRGRVLGEVFGHAEEMRDKKHCGSTDWHWSLQNGLSLECIKQNTEVLRIIKKTWDCEGLYIFTYDGLAPNIFFEPCGGLPCRIWKRHKIHPWSLRQSLPMATTQWTYKAELFE